MKAAIAVLLAIACAACGGSSATPSPAAPAPALTEVTTRGTLFHVVSPVSVATVSGASFGKQSAATVSFVIVNDASDAITVEQLAYVLFFDGFSGPIGLTEAFPGTAGFPLVVQPQTSIQHSFTEAWNETGVPSMHISVSVRRALAGGGSIFDSVTFTMGLTR